MYAQFLAKLLPKKKGERLDIDDKVFLEFYRLKKDFEGEIILTPAPGGIGSIKGESGRKEPKKDPLTVIIENINARFGTEFTEMDKVLLQMENDMAKDEKWADYAQNCDAPTFLSLFKKEFTKIAIERYEQNDRFFKKLFSEQDMMQEVIAHMSSALYERLKNKGIYPEIEETCQMVAEDADEYRA